MTKRKLAGDGLIYTGSGPFVRGVPAEDLGADDVAAIAEARGLSVPDLIEQLVASGLYASSAPPAAAPSPEG